MSGLFSPVFAKGKGQATTITSLTTGDPASCVVADKTGFAAGNHMFISHADDTVDEYLGTLVSAATTTFTFTLGTAITRASGAKLWAASASFCASSVPVPKSVRAEVDTGVIVLDAVGVALHTAVATQREYRTITLDLVTAAEWEAWRTFFVSTLSNGLKTFTAAWYDSYKAARCTYKVRLRNPNDALAPESIRGGYARFPVAIELLEAAQYV
jgi:hypothetical protein